MSDLPTLYAVTAAVTATRPDGGRKIVMHRKDHRGQHERPFVTLDEKHAREQESESVPGVVVVVPYVPASRIASLEADLDAANLEIAQLRLLLKDASVRLDGAWSLAPVELTEWKQTDFRPLSIREALAAYAAALAPKESFDE